MHHGTRLCFCVLRPCWLKSIHGPHGEPRNSLGLLARFIERKTVNSTENTSMLSCFMSREDLGWFWTRAKWIIIWESLRIYTATIMKFAKMFGISKKINIHFYSDRILYYKIYFFIFIEPIVNIVIYAKYVWEWNSLCSLNKTSTESSFSISPILSTRKIRFDVSIRSDRSIGSYDLQQIEERN